MNKMLKSGASLLLARCSPHSKPLVVVLFLVSLFLHGKAAEQISLTVRDLTPKFLEFYRSAESEHADEQQRWELWKKFYGFAAVPPTREGDRMARKMLDDSWPRYAGILPKVRLGAAGVRPPPREILGRVAGLLQADVPIRVTLVVFVGAFDNNAFTAPGQDGTPSVSVPVEGEGLDLIMTHELTHVVEGEEAGLSFGWQRTIAHTIFAEGLAMRVTQYLHPGRPDTAYVASLLRIGLRGQKRNDYRF